ncbi:ABC transporter ATP-binding protein [Dactylosporangium aurantiacum]|uniref:ABC transporter ATP-binding protein n=1 Tax=Dactylosporangium aurantiacum TaxID=35754 RepID=A0A9Q9MLG0_9ACTN|nr:ABC transporter ATP-binding protein [Dactylosporangium aurantiacum]MDG6103876.1 ABC transporter ATP-binding protein [Dactylosporangium aurantiacum]UWZ58930.1 ABC transporter ATP-binding protein [Dactylosporangium aurantiacum]
MTVDDEIGTAGRLRLLAAATALYLRAAPAAAVLRGVLTVAGGIAPVAIAWCTKVLLDRLAHGDGGTPLWPVAGIAGVATGWAVANHAGRYLEQEIARRVTLRTQLELFTAVSRPPGLAELESPAFHDRLQLARQASQMAPAQLTGAVLSIAQTTVTTVGFTATLAAGSPLVAGLVLLSTVPALLAQLRLGRHRSRTLVRITPGLRRQVFYAELLLDMRAAKEIRLFGLAGFFRDRMLTELRGAQAAERDTDRLALRVDGLLAVLAGAVSVAALAVLTTRVCAGDGTVGDLSVLVAALAALQGTLAGVVAELAAAGESLSLFRHYTAVTAAPPAAPAPAAAPPATGAPVIEFRDVWFRYSPAHAWILRGVSFTVPAGHSLALVGDNGAGKSTVVKLLCGFYPPTRGTILWDGTDIGTVDPAALRARMSAVFQDCMAYEFSAADNIALGDLTALGDDRRLRAAATEAGIDEALDRLPRGFATPLTRTFNDPGDTDDGVALSGGQWQRLALARAALRDRAELLILDEPSSGLDVYAEHEIHRRLTALRGRRTCLLISHRLNAVRDADAIAVLNGGVIAEHGTHAMLMRADGTYADMFRLQAGGYQMEPVQ